MQQCREIYLDQFWSFREKTECLRQQSRRDCSRLPYEFVERELCVDKNHERRVTDVDLFCKNMFENEKKYSRTIFDLSKEQKFRNGFFIEYAILKL